MSVTSERAARYLPMRVNGLRSESLGSHDMYHIPDLVRVKNLNRCLEFILLRGVNGLRSEYKGSHDTTYLICTSEESQSLSLEFILLRGVNGLRSEYTGSHDTTCFAN